MLGSRFLTLKTKQNKIITKFNDFFKSFLKFYKESLTYFLDKQRLIITFMIIVIVSSVLLFNFSKRNCFLLKIGGIFSNRND